MRVEIVEQAPLRVYALRNAAGEPIPRTYERLWTWSQLEGRARHVLYPIGVCYGDPGALTYYAALLMAEPVPLSGESEILDLPGGLYASTRHAGPYDRIAMVFRDLIETWLPANGFLRDARPALEFCHDNPETTPPGDLITDLMIPVCRPTLV